MDDLISRQSAINVVNAICERCGKYKEYNGVMCGACALDGVEDLIEDLPSAEPEDSTPVSWIKCEDGLPEFGTVVLITNEKNHVRCGQYRGVDLIHNSTGRYLWRWKGNVREIVTAWAPLPNPYREEDHESNKD